MADEEPAFPSSEGEDPPHAQREKRRAAARKRLQILYFFILHLTLIAAADMANYFAETGKAVSSISSAIRSTSENV